MKNFFKRSAEIITEWNEVWLVSLMVFCWPLFSSLLYIIDNDAAVIDAGVLQTIYIGCLAFAALHLFVWVGLKLNIPLIYSYFNDRFKINFNSLTQWQQTKVSLFVLSLYLVSAVLVFMAAASLAG